MAKLNVNNFFELSFSWYEEYSPVFYIGPEKTSQKQFEKLCDSLLAEASEKVVEKLFKNIIFRIL